MKRVYVAGAINDTDITPILDNIREGIRYAVKIMLAGFAPYCPQLDFLYRFLLKPGEEFPEGAFYRVGLSFVEVCDAMFVCPDSENSHGVKMEMAKAMSLGIPIYYSVQELIDGSEK